MRKFSRLTAAIVMVMMLTSMMFTSAFALSAENEAWLNTHIVAANDTGISYKDAAWLKNWLTTDSTKAENPSPITTYNGKQIYITKGKSEADLEKNIVSAINNKQTVDDVSNITDGLNIDADTQGAAALMSGFAPIISLVLGILVTMITIGMTIFSAFDIAYIAFPVFRNKCEDSKMNGGAMAKKTSNGDSKLRFVTDDAQYAVQQGSVESGKSPWAIYFGKRVMSYILLAIILFILLTGNISLITNIALKIVSGIMDVLSGLA